MEGVFSFKKLYWIWNLMHPIIWHGQYNLIELNIMSSIKKIFISNTVALFFALIDSDPIKRKKSCCSWCFLYVNFNLGSRIFLWNKACFEKIIVFYEISVQSLYINKKGALKKFFILAHVGIFYFWQISQVDTKANPKGLIFFIPTKFILNDSWFIFFYIR